ncbi:unnamed protein product, partial [Scytosiphon promiscuus]
MLFLSTYACLASPSLQPRTGTVHLKGGLFGWWKRELSIVHEDNLRLCKAKRAWTTGSCEEVPLDELSEV